MTEAPQFDFDYAIISANLGVNPALAILALAERATARFPRAIARCPNRR